jgi:hypothetical protein
MALRKRESCELKLALASERLTERQPGGDPVGFGELFGQQGAERDGTSPEKAIVVQSVDEEYEWIQHHFPGFRVERQVLGEFNGKPFDILNCRNDQGEERTVFFDISAFLGD